MEQDVPGSTHLSDRFKSLNPKDLNPGPFLAHHPREPERPRSSHILTRGQYRDGSNKLVGVMWRVLHGPKAVQ